MTQEFLERTLKYLLCQSWYLEDEREVESLEAFEWLMKEENQEYFGPNWIGKEQRCCHTTRHILITSEQTDG